MLSAIIFGDLAPRAAVDEKSLAEEFGVGVSGVRQALFRLAIEGLVERQPRMGTQIAGLGIAELRDVFEARLIIEGRATAIAAERASQSEIDTILQIARDMAKLKDSRDFRELLRLDQLFHDTIAKATKNAVLERQLVTLYNNAARFWFLNAPRLSREKLATMLRQHDDIALAVASRDSQLAEHHAKLAVGEFPAFTEFFALNSNLY